MQKLMPGSKPPDRKSGDGCGTSVAVDGTTLVMGCPGHDLRAADGGIIVVYLYNGTAWLQHQVVSYDLSGPEDRCVRPAAHVGGHLLPIQGGEEEHCDS